MREESQTVRRNLVLLVYGRRGLRPPFFSRYGISTGRLERWGGGLSLACAIHCLAMPLLLALFPLAVATVYLGERLEGALVVCSVLFSAAALCRGFRIHRRRRILLLLATACALIAVGRLGAREPLEAVFVVGGSLCLAAGNLLNHRLCRSCARCGEDQADTSEARS